MPNNKAQKISILQKPPLLNLSKNTPWITSDFQTVEDNNAPYINEMLQPLWKQTIEGDSVFDKYGNRYYLQDGNLYKNDKLLQQSITQKHFKRTDITEEYGKYLSFDIDPSGKLAYIDLDTTGDVSFYYNNNLVKTRHLFSSGTVVTSRVRICCDEVGENPYPIAVIVYRDVTDALKYCILSPTVNNTDTISWKNQVIKNAGTAANNIISGIDVTRSYPLINICTYGTRYGITLISNFAKNLLATRTNNEFADGIETFVIDGSTLYRYGSDLLPAITTQTKVVTSTYGEYWNFSFTATNNAQNATALYDGTSFYEYDGTNIGNVLTGVTFTDAGYTVTINGTTFNAYNYIRYQQILTITSRAVGPLGSPSWAVLYTTFDGDSYWSDYSTDSRVSYTFSKYTTKSTDLIGIESIMVYIDSGSGIFGFDVPEMYWNGQSNFYGEYTTTTTSTVGSLTHPNVFLDSGEMVCYYGFNQASKQSYSTGNYITETANNVDFSTPGAYTWNIIESVPISVSSLSVNSIGRGFAQNFATSTVRLSNIAFATAAPTSGTVIEYNNSNCSDLRYGPGTQYDPSYSYYNDGMYTSGSLDMEAIFTVAGYRSKLNDYSPWNILVNTPSTGATAVWGLSYSNSDEEMGTLVTEWTDVDENTYIIANPDYLIYKDRYNKLYKVSVEDGVVLTSIIDDRYIIINTTDYFNCYDSQLSLLTHYASDYNGRALAGSTSYVTQSYLTEGRTVANGINNAISDSNEVSKDNDRIASILIPSRAVIRPYVSSKFKAFKCRVPYSLNATVKGIDIYYSTLSDTSPYYRYSIRTDGKQTTYKKFDLDGTAFSTSGNILFSPNIFTQYINGAGNNDFVKEATAAYMLTYWNSAPILLYDPTTEVDNVNDFFILQGQYYAVINDKIYSVIYSNGAISEIDAIVDIKGFRFLGNTPAIAFFYSDKLRAIFSFTGDANMSKLWNASKYKNLYLSTNGRYFYDESTQSCFIPTDQGLLVFGTDNSFLLRDYKNITNIQFSNDMFHVMDSGNTYNFAYYKPDDEDFTSQHVLLETSFYGAGGGEVSTIDRWSITLYNPDEKTEGSVKLKTTTLTDTMTESEEVEKEILPGEWDSLSNSVLINYNPKLIKGQGIRLIIDSPWTIQSIIPHIADQGTTTLSKTMR